MYVALDVACFQSVGYFVKFILVVLTTFHTIMYVQGWSDCALISCKQAEMYSFVILLLLYINDCLMSSINVQMHNFMPSCSASFALLASCINNSDIKANYMCRKYAHSIHSCHDLSCSRSVASSKVSSLDSVIKGIQ